MSHSDDNPSQPVAGQIWFLRHRKRHRNSTTAYDIDPGALGHPVLILETLVGLDEVLVCTLTSFTSGVSTVVSADPAGICFGPSIRISLYLAKKWLG